MQLGRHWPKLRLIGSRTLLAAFGWWVISEGQPEAFWAGVIAVPAAVALSVALVPTDPYRIRPLGLLLFTGYFLVRSLVAGFDVARRILHPALQIDPAVEYVPLRLEAGAPRWLLANTLSLLPGTLSVAFEGDTLVLHCLSRSGDREGEVRAVEARVARVFGLAGRSNA